MVAYRLKRREGIAGGVRRIVGEQLERAVDELEGRRSEDEVTALVAVAAAAGGASPR